MRDALSALDQILAFSSDRVTSADVSTVLGLIGRDLQFEIAETVAQEDVAGAFRLAGVVVESGFDLRIVCRELARLMRDLMVVKIDPARLTDPDIAGEDERDRLSALAGQYSREDLIRAFDLIAKAETDIRASSQPRHLFEMALVKWIHLRKLTPLTELIGGLERGGGGPAAEGRRPMAEGHRAEEKLRTSNFELRTSAKSPTSPAGSSAGKPAPRIPEAQGPDVKTRLLSSVRDQNKSFYHMVIAQAKSVEAEGDAVVFTFAPVHKGLRAQLEGRRGWLEQLAHATSGRKIAVVTREGAALPAAAAADDPALAHKSALRARAQADPGVQAVLDVFGGEIEDVEEIK